MYMYCWNLVSFIMSYTLRMCSSMASSCSAANRFESSTTRARYPPPPAPGIFHAITPGMLPYLSMAGRTLASWHIFPSTDGSIMPGNIAT